MIRNRRQNTSFQKRNFREVEDEESATKSLKLITDKVCSCPFFKVLLRTWEWKRARGSLNPGLCHCKEALSYTQTELLFQYCGWEAASGPCCCSRSRGSLHKPAKVYASPIYNFSCKNTGVYPSPKAPLS